MFIKKKCSNIRPIKPTKYENKKVEEVISSPMITELPQKEKKVVKKVVKEEENIVIPQENKEIENV